MPNVDVKGCRCPNRKLMDGKMLGEIIVVSSKLHYWSTKVSWEKITIAIICEKKSTPQSKQLFKTTNLILYSGLNPIYGQSSLLTIIALTKLILVHLPSFFSPSLPHYNHSVIPLPDSNWKKKTNIKKV